MTPLEAHWFETWGAVVETQVDVVKSLVKVLERLESESSPHNGKFPDAVVCRGANDAIDALQEARKALESLAHSDLVPDEWPEEMPEVGNWVYALTREQPEVRRA